MIAAPLDTLSHDVNRGTDFDWGASRAANETMRDGRLLLALDVDAAEFWLLIGRRPPDPSFFLNRLPTPQQPLSSRRTRDAKRRPMTSERVQRRIDSLLDQIEGASDERDWDAVAEKARAVLALDGGNEDASAFLQMAVANGVTGDAETRVRRPTTVSTEEPANSVIEAVAIVEAAEATARGPDADPESFAAGRYRVLRFLGEGGKKRVFLAHDTLLDRDVAFALIKTEGLDAAGRERIVREAQAMGRLGTHPHVVTIFEIGEESGAPYVVNELLEGGDVEGELAAAEGPLPLERTLSIAKDVCRGLEFAHARSIVHRDVKPGNVWLTAEGTAKIGDFGLAISLDRSRLTQLGMMVGTADYMPPEQALGGETTPQADLYSLGAMLYEMVTGRPPFVGDNTTSVISQHINTPPIAPSWHSPECPPQLEALIVRLLEKDPTVRPPSASEVSRTLDSIVPAQQIPLKPSVERNGSQSANPLYRTTFVGREPEMKQLQAAFDGAISGQGELTMVVGEPGIGKTTVTEQLGTYAMLRGGMTLVGHCYEEGSLSLPYLPFVEAMRAYVLDRETDDLRSELGPGAGAVARIVSEVRDRIDLPAAEPASPDEERFRLMQAVTSFLRNAAEVRPLCLVLEDLHDADRGTLDLLNHLARNLSGSRLLIVGTYRDIEVDRAHPLSSALAELRRSASFERVMLRGLSPPEVQRMLSNLAGHDVPFQLGEAVFRQTEGNPLFVQEVLRFLAEEGLIARTDGQWQNVSDRPLAMQIPEGLRDVIGKRLSRLSDAANEVLAVAAVIGREFEFSTLATVADASEDELAGALEEAVAAAVIEERSQLGGARYRFTHAFFRQTLYEELIAPRRLRLHQWIARAMEQQHAERLDEHAAELAEHFSQSSDPTDLVKAVEYGERAAVRAMSAYAYAEAARLLDRAIEIQRLVAADDVRLRDLLLAACEAAQRVPDYDRLAHVLAPETFELAERIASPRRAARAAAQGAFALGSLGGVPALGWDETGPWIERIERYAGVEPKFRALADLVGGARRQLLGDPTGVDNIIAGFDLARTLDDAETFGVALNYILVLLEHPQFDGDRLSWARDAAEHTGRTGDFSSLTGAISTFLSFGDRERAEALIDDLERRVTERRLSPARVNAWKAVMATLDGRLEHAVDVGEELTAAVRVVVRNRAFLHLGRFDEAIEGAHEPWARVVHLAASGHLERARTELSAIDRAIPSDWLLTLELEARTLLGDTDEVSSLLDELSSGTAITTGLFYPTMIDRHRAAALHLLGQHVEARERYDAALRDAERIRFRPEVALVRLGLAKLLLDHYPDERDVALDHLAFAIDEFGEMKMQPAIEEALAKKEILKA